MEYKGSELTIEELLFALHSKVIDLSKSETHFKQSQLEPYVEKIGEISRAFKRCFNAAAAINQFPLEVLTQVFESAQVQRSSKGKFPPPFALSSAHGISEVVDGISWIPLTMHICSYWRDILVSTASLWEYVHFKVNGASQYNTDWRFYPPPSLVLRSGFVPAHITVQIDNPTHHYSEAEELNRSLQLFITPLAKTLQICWEGRTMAGALDLLHHPFPQVTSLTLCARMGGLSRSIPADLPAGIFRGTLPQLRRLSLWFYASWSHHNFPNLTHVSFHQQEVRPSVDGFLDLLECTPHLEFLFLCEAGPRIAQDDPLPQRTVSLPSLHVTQFESKSKTSNEEYNIRILERLIFRRLTHCSVVGKTRDRYTRMSPGVLEKIFTHINPEGIIEFRVYQCKGDAYGVDLDASRISIQTRPYTLVTVPSPRCNNIRHLHLVSPARIPEVKWDGFPNLLSITCYDSLEGINNFVKSLSMQTKDKLWPCPLLEIIYLRGGEQPPDAGRMKNVPVVKSLSNSTYNGALISDEWIFKDRGFLEGVLSSFPESTVVHRNQGSSYQVVLELGSPLPENLQTEGSVTFPR